MNKVQNQTASPAQSDALICGTPWQPGPDICAQIDEVSFKSRLPQAGRSYLEQCIKLGPSRKVQGRLGNIVLRFHSRKLATGLLLESRTGEYPMAVTLEKDPGVCAYFPQPPAVNLESTDGKGRITTTQLYTPDFLAVRDTEIVVIETRVERRLFDQMLKSPHQFSRDPDGKWHFSPAEKYFSSLGFRYELRTTASLPGKLVENERFLEDYISEDCPPLTDEEAAAIARFIQDRRFAPLHVLLEQGFGSDQIFKAIADSVVTVDLTATLLAATDDVYVYADEATQTAHQLVARSAREPALPIPGSMLLRTGSQLTFDGRKYTVLLVGEREVMLEDENGIPTPMDVGVISRMHDLKMLEADGVKKHADMRQLADCSPGELARAVERLNAARSGESSSFAARSISRFVTQIAHAANDLEALIALVDNRRESGNRKRKVSVLNEEIIAKAISERYNIPEQTTKKGAYHRYLKLCAYFSDRGRLFQADRGRQNGVAEAALGKRTGTGLTLAQSSTISLKRAAVGRVPACF